jgi:outer membrane receptor protein involved in Fe transport
VFTPALALASAMPAVAQPTYDVTVRARRPVTSGSNFVLDAESFELRRMDRPDRILEVVPSLLTAQHAGGGKSNQYLVRGFDADHGTDFAFFVDGVPMNMRSHAHGQGFAEMHWLIPEAIDRIDVSMGPYDVEYGDFATAGAANLRLREAADESFVKVTGGQWQSIRSVGVYSPKRGVFGGEDPKATLFSAFEFNTGDGPFENDEDLLQYKGLARFGAEFGESTRLSGWFAAYDGRWNASGQIPQRWVGREGVNRWDSVDPSEGGDSARQIGQVRVTHDFSPNQKLEVTGWASHYMLDLGSNFSLFLEDPENGDGILQEDDRVYFGGTAVYRHSVEWRLPVLFSAGLDQRSDFVTASLSKQRRRTRLDRISSDRIDQTSVAAFAEADVALAPWARFVGGVRAEGFWFDVRNRKQTQTGPRADGRVSEDLYLPKANLILAPFAAEGPLPAASAPIRDTQIFLNWGQGFHSNDARDVVANPQQRVLPIAMGWEVGLRTSVQEWLDVSLAYWWLHLQSELVFVGDAGDTEAKGRSRRQGVEVAVRAQPLAWLTGEASVAYSSSEFSNGDAVPQAPRLVAKASLTATHDSGLSAELDFTALGRRYGVEDRSVKLHGYAILDFAVRYRRGPIEGLVGLDNVLGSEWRSSEFYYESRLQDEAEGAEDFHFTPGYPRNVRVGLTYYFR